MSGAALLAAIGSWPLPAGAANLPSVQQAIQQQAARAQALRSGAVAAPRVSTQQAAQIAQAMRNVARADAAIRAQLTGQEAARSLARSLAATDPQVLDGLARPGYAGGLKVHSAIGTNPDAVWSGALAPVETATADGVSVEVRQTQPKAILTWESFDIGARTTLDFKQPGQDAVALNRVLGSVRPSKIMGKITADGQVYVINRNGILFTGTAQINVGGLVASSLDIGLPYQSIADRNRYFSDPGNGSLSFSFNLPKGDDGKLRGALYAGYDLDNFQNAQVFVPQADPLEGAVEVQPGALIRTPPLSQTNPYLGRVVLAAPRVDQRGTIETPDGQSLLVAARNFTLISNDDATIAALKTAAGGFAATVLTNLAADPDLRGAQVLAGSEDYFTVLGPSREQITALSPFDTFNFVPVLSLDARGAVDGRGGVFDGPLADSPLIDASNPAGGRGFLASNAGLISAPRGNITVNGQAVSLSSAPASGLPGGLATGVLSATTAVNANGSVYIDGRFLAHSRVESDGVLLSTESFFDPAAVELSANSVIALLPDITATPPGQAAAAGDAMLARQPTLPSDPVSAAQFRRPIARLDIRNRSLTSQNVTDIDSSIGSIELAEGSLIAAPSALVRLATSTLDPDPVTGRLPPSDPPANILLRQGAEIDVAGIMDVVLPMSSNAVRVPRIGNADLADTPLQRNGFLFGREVFVDRRRSGIRADGTRWFGSPLLNGQGYVESFGRTVGELLTPGGEISFAGVTRVEPGSALNAAGGFVRYLDGSVATTWLRSADGKAVVDIGSADPDVAYGSFADEFTVRNQRFGNTDAYPTIYASRRATFERGYIQGADGGAITFVGAAVINGSMSAGAVSGSLQRAGSGRVASPPARGGRLDLGGLNGRTELILASDPQAMPPSTYAAQVWSTKLIEDAGFADVIFGSVGGRTIVEQDATLTLPNGGTLTLRGDDIDIGGRIIAHAGNITVALSAFNNPLDTSDDPGSDTESPRTRMILRPGAVLDVSGLWVNDGGAGRDTLTGRDWINAGSVTITNGGYQNESFIPDIATITLSQGSLIDLGGGGYVDPGSRLASDERGVPLGRGGSLAVLLHPSVEDPGGDEALDFARTPSFIFTPGGSGESPADVRSLIDDELLIASDIRAFGFQGGGAFSLRVPEVDVLAGGGTLGGDNGQIAVPAEFFSRHGFGEYRITGLLRAGIEAGTSINLSQQQYIPGLQAGAASSLADAAVLGQWGGLQRTPVGLRLAGLGWTDNSYIGAPIFAAGGPLLPENRSFYADHALVIGNAATITADPGASIVLAARGQLTLGEGSSITAPGGNISLRQQMGFSQQGGFRTSLPNTSLFLAPGARLSAAGAFLSDDSNFRWRDGAVLAGGNVSLVAATLIGMPGSVIDVSGSAAVIDLPRPARFGVPEVRIPTLVSSDAGAVSLSVGVSRDLGPVYIGAPVDPGGTGVFDGTMIARPGGAGNSGGTLQIAGQAITVVADERTVPEQAAPAEFLPRPFPGPPGSPLRVFAYSPAGLTDSGVDALSLVADAGGGAANTISFSGSPQLSLDRSLQLSAASFRWLREGVLDPALAPAGTSSSAALRLRPTDAALVTLRAPYLRIGGTADDPADGRVPTAIPLDASGRRGPTLFLGGGSVDVRGNVSLFNFGTTEIAAGGDLRLTPGFGSGGAVEYQAGLLTAGDLEIAAGQVYPATGVIALLQSLAVDGRIDIAGSGQAAPVPLSAGGQLMLSARNIAQGGVLRAPLGVIRLGVTEADAFGEAPVLRDEANQPVFVATDRVEIVAGSLTSVSAEGLLIPYGSTRNQREWLFNDGAITVPPEKRIVLDAAGAAIASGAMLDLSGGGDVYASEFIPGLGGSRNVLRSALSRDSSGPVYAILPGRQPVVAPVDPALNDLQPDAPGRTLTLRVDIPGGPPAGTYTLLPGEYATLPGAYRVQQVADRDLAAGAVITEADGGHLVGASLGWSSGGPSSARSGAWSVKPLAAWGRYSEIATSGANAFFAQRAGSPASRPPRLPNDAGTLQLQLSEELAVGAAPFFGRGPGGRGGQVDIAAERIAVVSGSAALDGFLVLNPGTIAALAAESVVLGAIRSSEADGDRLDVRASEVVVRTTGADPLINPELVLVATGDVRVEAGSVVRAEGPPINIAGRDLLIGRDEVADPLPFNPPLVPGVSGDAGLLRLSNGAAVDVVRTNLPAAPIGSVLIDAGAVIDGGRALVIDAAGQAVIDGTAVILADAIDLASTDLNLLAPEGTPGADIGAASLSAILQRTGSLTLRASNAITFWAPIDLRPASGSPRLAELTLNAPRIAGSALGGGTVALDAALLTLTNEGTPSAGPAVAGPGGLALSGQRIVLTGRERRIDGFDLISLRATEAVSAGDGGQASTLRLPGMLVLDTPLLAAANGSAQTLSVAGSIVASNGSGGTAGPLSEIGGKLVLEGSSIVIDTTVAAPAGVLELGAVSGDIVLQDDARLLAPGYAQSFLDKRVVLAGGTLSLRADAGSVIAEPGSVIDVSAAPGGNAGSLKLAVAGAFNPAGALSGGADADFSGAAFMLDSRSAVDLDAVASAFGAGGFSRRFVIRSAAGDLLLSQGLRAQEVSLVADGGRIVLGPGATIDASGASGGRIGLWATSGVTLAGGSSLLAYRNEALSPPSDDAPRGGRVEIGTGDGGPLQLLPGSLIDVRGGSAYGSSGGTIHLRTPAVLADAAVLEAAFSRSPMTAVAGSPLTPVIFEPYTRVELGSGGDVALTAADLEALARGFAPSTDALQVRWPGLTVQPGLELANSSGGITISDGAIDLSALRYGASQQPGWLGIRAAGDLILDVSLSDGFTDATGAGELGTISFADAIAGRVPAGLSSWSYRLTAGARTDSADPMAVQAGSDAGDFRFGDVGWVATDRAAPLGRNDIIRTGTGSIAIAAAGSVEVLNPSSVIYTAGVGVDWTTIPGFIDLPLSLLDPRWRDLVLLYRRSASSGVNPSFTALRGTLPALPTLGGDLRIAAGGDLVGRQNITDVTGRLTDGGFASALSAANYVGQVFSPWLYFQGAASLSPDVSGQFGGEAADSNSPTIPSLTIPATQPAGWITTGTFQQGVAALGGGDIVVRTGGSVQDASLSVVSTYAVSGGKAAGEAVALHRFGGGDLSIEAGGDISSSIVYVGKGRGEIRSGGALIAGYSVPILDFSGVQTGGIPIASTLALGDASLEIAVRGDAQIGQVISDTLNERFALDIPPTGEAASRRAPRLSSYGLGNILTVTSASASIGLSTEAPAASTYGRLPFDPFRFNFAPYTVDNYLPPRVLLAALRGDIRLRNDSWMTLAPSPIGSLDLLAQGSISYAFRRLPQPLTANQGAISLLDIDPSVLSNPLNPNTFLGLILPSFGRGYGLDTDNTEDPRLNRFSLHAGPQPLHLNDPEPVRIVALEGDIVSGAGLAPDTDGGIQPGQGGALFFNKRAEIFAGRDIVNLTYTGENNRDSDVTSIRAGRDITFAVETLRGGDAVLVTPAGGSFVIGGPGTFILESGRNLDLRPSAAARTADPTVPGDFSLPARQFGVLAVGNRINPYRQAESADLALLFGTALGKDIASFIDRYIDPANAGSVEQNYIGDLMTFMAKRATDLGIPGASTPEQALAAFRTLPKDEQLPLISRLYSAELRSIVPAPDAAFTAGQARAFEAVATLFPAGFGYTDQLATVPQLSATGDLDMVNALVRTDYGSSIAFIGPGGDAEIGGFSVDAALPLNFQGIFTLRGGAIDAALDGSFNVNNSRVITAQGGDITIFSGNGDIDAGRGARTASFSPPIRPTYTSGTQALVDFGGVITGSGIGTLVTLPGGEVGDVFLIAPRGTVDAGEGGIRAAGNLAIVAVQVLNASNVQVGGASIGLPQAAASPAGALSSTQGTQAQLGGQALEQIAAAGAGQPAAGSLPSIVTVEVLSFGE